MRTGLSVYGTTFGMGIHPASGRPMITPRRLMDKAIAAGLEGVDLPTSLMKSEDTTTVAHYAQERELFITLETEGCEPCG
jgi:3-oxoisoapionate decarboxylase